MIFKNDCWRTKQLNSATYQEDLFYNSIIETVLDCFMPKWIIRANMFPLMNITQKPSYNWYCQFRWNANSVKFHIWPNDKKSGIWLKKNLSSEDVIEKQNLEWFSLERQFRRFRVSAFRFGRRFPGAPHSSDQPAALNSNRSQHFHSEAQEGKNEARVYWKSPISVGTFEAF